MIFCKLQPLYFCFSPNVGDLVCVENDDNWSRGYVVEKLTAGYKVALIDEAKYIHSTNPCKVLPEHETIPEFACQGKASNGLSDMVSSTIPNLGSNLIVCFFVG